MEADSIQIHAKLERYYWWWVGRRKIIEKILQRYFPKKTLRILDWGCGTGGNFSMLEKFGSVLGVDASDEALRLSKEKGMTNLVKAGNLQEFVVQKKENQAPSDLLTCFDVLEHIPDDEIFLRDAKELLAPGGYILITVPAYQFLWSELDDLVGHIRRYTRKGLEAKLENAGFETVKSSYFVMILFLPILFYRFLGKITGRSKQPNFSYIEFPKIINWFFARLVFLEARLIRFLNFPFGTSIILLARKR